MRRILFVYDGKMNRRGCDLDTHHMLEALSRHGDSIDLISRGRVTQPGVHCHVAWYNPAKVLSNAPSPVYAGARRRFLGWLGVRQLRRQNYDIVMAWGKQAASLFAEARDQGIRTILHAGNLHVDSRRPEAHPPRWPAIGHDALRREYELADWIMVPSDFCRDSFLQHGLPENKVIRVERGADLDAFAPPQTPAPGYRVLFCGRVCERKGARQVYEAWKEAAIPGSELWYVGPIDNDLKSWAASVSSEQVQFMGHRDDLPDLMRRCQVQVLLSDNEGLAKSLIEGSVSGLVPIITPETGLPIQPGIHGFQVQRSDRFQAVQALKSLAHDRDQLHRMSTAVADWSRQHYNWERFYRDFLASPALV